MLPYRVCYWDISGVCNAACRYCPSGSRSIIGNLHKSQAGFLSPEDFDDGLAFMIDRGIITPGITKIDLYSWGEPFLHPQFETMLKIISSKGIGFGLSTNASTLKEIPIEAMPMLKDIIFSMPGFSQESYDKMHGFSFNMICENIRSIVSSIRTAKLREDTGFAIIYHMYKFNRHEIDSARAFASEMRIGFTPIVANLTGFAMPMNHKLYEDLVVDNCHVEAWERIKMAQASLGEKSAWHCPQYDSLALDEYSNIVQCCATERFVSGYIIGKLKEVDFSGLRELKRAAPICILCKEHGIGWLAHNVNHIELINRGYA